ncbi:MAG: 7-cyano-7-deazaguanine synthase, partial [Candidatus Natronoplasma sp.]
MDPESFIEEKVEEIKKADGKAVVGCSGGVDSTVSTVLASRALGDDLLAIYVDTGYMRKNETENMESIFEEMDINHRMIDA